MMRLLFMSKDISEGKGIVVRRPERDYLLDVRYGKINYSDLLNQAEKIITEIKKNFDNINIPDNVDQLECQELILNIRLDMLNY